MSINLTIFCLKIILFFSAVILTKTIEAEQQNQIKNEVAETKIDHPEIKQIIQMLLAKNAKSELNMTKKALIPTIKIIESIRFQPQIQEYSIVKEVLYPEQKFERTRNSVDVIKQLKEKIMLNQNDQIARANQNLNKLHSQLNKYVQTEVKNMSEVPVQKNISQTDSPKTLEYYQKPNEQQDKKKSDLIQELKRQLRQRQRLRKEKLKKEEERKKEEEAIKNFDQMQKQELQKINEQKQKKRKELQKLEIQREEQLYRKRMMNHERFKKQQEMQMKQLQIGFNPSGGVNTMKLLEQKRKKMEAQLREDEAYRRNDLQMQRKQKNKQDGKPEKLNENSANMDNTGRLKIIDQLVKTQENEADKKKRQQRQKLLAELERAKVLKDQFQRMNQQRLIQLEKMNRMVNEKQADKVIVIQEEKQMNLSLLVKDKEPQKKQLQTVVESQYSNQLINSQQVQNATNQQANKQFGQSQNKNQKFPDNVKQSNKNELENSILKQDIINRIKRYEQQKKLNNKLQVESSKWDNITSNKIDLNLLLPSVQMSKTVNEVQIKNDRQLDTDTVLYDKLDERIKKSSQSQIQKQNEQDDAFLEQKEGIFSDLFMYFIMGVIIFIAVCFIIRPPVQIQGDENITKQKLLKGSLIPSEEIED